MQYRSSPKIGEQLSILGFGCMRLPKDPREQEQLICRAVDAGVNYFDTAYIYPGSEAALGRALAQNNLRGRVKIATKLPHYLVRKYEDIERIFAAQLRRLQTDYVDYYLIHTLNDTAIWQRLVDVGILRWIEEKRQAGQIINLGFSYHGGSEEFLRVTDAYDWDFCLIQYNYLDVQRQAGQNGLEYAAAKGLAVMVMEPLRGGRLVNALPKRVRDIWDSAHIKRGPAEWALRFVWDHPGVTVVLSGMNSMAMLEENIAVAGNAVAGGFSDEEKTLFVAVRQELEAAHSIPCTGCNYCLPCPHGVDIPTCFSCLNDIDIEGKSGARRKYLMQTTMKAESLNASRCTGCGRCEKHCPQSIAIREELKRVIKTLEGPFYKPARLFIKRFMRLKV